MIELLNIDIELLNFGFTEKPVVYIDFSSQNNVSLQSGNTFYVLPKGKIEKETYFGLPPVNGHSIFILNKA